MASKTTQTTQSEPWKPAQSTLTTGLDMMNAAVSADPTGVNSIAGPNALTTESNNALLSFARDSSGMQGTEAARQYGMDFLEAGPMALNDNVFSNVMSKVNPAVAAQFGTAGRVGSGAHQDTITRALTEAYAPMETQNAQQGVTNMFQAANMLPSMDQAIQGDQVMRAGLIGTIGEQQRADEQALLDAPYLQAQRLLGTGGAVGSMGGTSTGTESGNGLGNAMQILGLGAGLFSDRRLKENISPVGTTDGGQRIYTYNYAGDDTVVMGVMADETPPQAVHYIGGVAKVDYSRVA